MTALNRNAIPNEITTIEQLHAWTSSVLSDTYLTLTAIEDTNVAVRCATSAPYYVTATQTPSWRLISRTSFELNSNWKRNGRIWVNVKELGTTAIASDFTSGSNAYP